jgi:hypothetical protein
MEPKLDVQASDLKVEKLLDQNIHHIDQGNVCHYYINIDGQCDKFEDETIKGLTNMQTSTNLDEI